MGGGSRLPPPTKKKEKCWEISASHRKFWQKGRERKSVCSTGALTEFVSGRAVQYSGSVGRLPARLGGANRMLDTVPLEEYSRYEPNVSETSDYWKRRTKLKKKEASDV